MKKNNDQKGRNAILNVSSLKALTLHVICGLGLALAFWVPNHTYSRDLITHPSQTLRLISFFSGVPGSTRDSPVQSPSPRYQPMLLCQSCRPRLASASCRYFPKTLSWSLLMSLLTFVPAACVFGSSWTDWHRIFARTKANESTDYMICLPAHGAVIGAWFGAWPMPLDWESPWQEWPICVTYGAITGYLVGLVASLGCIFFRNHHQHLKEE